MPLALTIIGIATVIAIIAALCVYAGMAAGGGDPNLDGGS